VTSTSILCSLLLALFVLLSGIAVLVWPAKLQGISIRWHERHPKLDALNPFSAWIRTPDALLAVRAGGVVLICISLVVFYFAWKACSG
jgi:hypothetical protein